MTWRVAAAIAAAALPLAGATGAHASVLLFSAGDVTSGSFGDAHIMKGGFTDTIAFAVEEGGDFSASLTSAAPKLKKSGDLDFTSVVLSGLGGQYSFTLLNNDGPDHLTDSAVFSRFLESGSYLLTISGYSYGNAQFGGNTSLTVASVPETGTWLLMVAGFGLAGAAMRRRSPNLEFG